MAVVTAGTKVCANAGCPNAGVPQPHDAFYMTGGYPSGRCRPCHSAYMSAHRKVPSERKIHSRRERDRRRAIRAAEAAERAAMTNQFPAEPFLSWLRTEVLPRCDDLAQAGELVGLSADSLRHRLASERPVNISTVDKAVTTWGDPGILDRLYPL